MSRFTAAAWLSVLALSGSAYGQDQDQGQVLQVLQSAAQEHRLHPQVTPTPTLAIRADARARQVTRGSSTSTTTFTITNAPDATCGFLSGNSGVAVTCANGKKCAWEAELIGAVFCGFAATDRSYLRCFPRDIAVDPVQCNDVCQSNSFHLLCTDSAAPYCRTYAFPDGVRDFRCASTSVASAQQVLWSYSGQVNRQLTTSVLGGDTVNSDPADPIRSISFTSIPGPTVTSTDPSITPDPVTTGPGPTNPNDPNDNKSDPPLGPIIGGVVGGVAVLALILTGIFFLIRRNKRHNQNIQGNVASPGVPPNQPSPGHDYHAGSVGYASAPQIQQVPGYQGIPPPGATSPSPTYDSTFKPGAGNISPHTPSMLSMNPPAALYQEHYKPQWGPTPSPPPVQPGVAPNQGVYPQHAPQGGPVYEIGTVEDQHKGRINELG